jgi:hypothetical protein
VENKGSEVDRGKSDPGDSNDSTGGEPRAAPERKDASGNEAKERSRRIGQLAGHRGKAGVDTRESFEPGSEPPAAQVDDLIGQEMAHEDGPENCCGRGT